MLNIIEDFTELEAGQMPVNVSAEMRTNVTSPNIGRHGTLNQFSELVSGFFAFSVGLRRLRVGLIMFLYCMFLVTCIFVFCSCRDCCVILSFLLRGVLKLPIV